MGKMTIDELIKRLEAATEGSLELDAAVLLSTGHSTWDTWGGPRWFYKGIDVANDVGTVPVSTSVDAALSFCTRVLPPGDAITIGLNIHHRKWVASINRLHENGTPYSVAWGDAPEKSPALALTLAACRAIAGKEKT